MHANTMETTHTRKFQLFIIPLNSAEHNGSNAAFRRELVPQGRIEDTHAPFMVSVMGRTNSDSAFEPFLYAGCILTARKETRFLGNLTTPGIALEIMISKTYSTLMNHHD
ncbi:unnamed protein product [Notodromas monacha]|uniref:Uncharacterized protein n=1 Tax=Notodromas monacha TaxID=399045 RepID=A0A7R9GFN8_9CRUS|nr:unnamed protein product [Notodromas monacha]CAG0920971.1 unnamed protein product [Notodromas monacha]